MVRIWWCIREWDGSQHRAVEELCFQLRDKALSGWQTVQTAAPDGGGEWYDLASDGTAHGFQVKFVRDVDTSLPAARVSARTVGSNRQDCNIVELTFLVPFALLCPAPRRHGQAPSGSARPLERTSPSGSRTFRGWMT